MTASPDLPLASREGLPDAIAYLRGAHPRSRWRDHANFGELSAFWLQVHDSLRAHGGQLDQGVRAFREQPADVERFQRFFVPRLNQFLQHLTAHHHIEDSAYFPRFRDLDPRMASGFDLLEADHGLIHETLLASVDEARRLLAALATDQDSRRRAVDGYAAVSGRLQHLLLRHLADEEDLVIPAMLEHGERSLG